MPKEEHNEGYERILSLFFNTTGFGYVVMGTPLKVIEKGVKSFKPVSNTKQRDTIFQLIEKHRPERVVFENPLSSKSLKRVRIKRLLRKLRHTFREMGIPFKCYDRDQIRLVFDLWKAKSKYEIALVISKSLPAFNDYMYEKPVYPKTEHYRTAAFDAAALGITHYYVTT